MRIKAIAGRIINQLRHDKRTMALVLLAPIIVLTLVYLVFDAANDAYTISVIKAPKAVIQEIKSNDDYDMTVQRDSKAEAIDAVRSQKAIAAVSVNSDCSKVKIYVDGSNASDAKKVRGVIEQSVGQVVKDDAKAAMEDVKDEMAANPMAPKVDLD